MTNEIHVRVVADMWECVSSYEAAEVFRGLPKAWRFWDRERRLWIVSSWAWDVLRSRAEIMGWKLVFAEQQARKPPAPAARQGGTWADALFAELPGPLAESAYKALIRVLHPDRGGDLVAMQTLNTARDHARAIA